MRIKTFSDYGFKDDRERIEKLDMLVNEWLKKNYDLDIVHIQRNEDGQTSYITICYNEDEG